MKRLVQVCVLMFCVAGIALADSGILLPRDKQQPDPAVLSLEEMEITQRMLRITLGRRRCKLKYFHDACQRVAGLRWKRRAGLACLLALLTIGAAGAAARWEYAEGGSGVEAALYRWMPMPVSRVLGLRPPRESVPLLGELIAKQPTAELYSLRAMSEEAALDFRSAESDWKKYAEIADDRIHGQLALADFYHRRLRPADEVAALTAAARAPVDQKAWASPWAATSPFYRHFLRRGDSPNLRVYGPRSGSPFDNRMSICKMSPSSLPV